MQSDAQSIIEDIRGERREPIPGLYLSVIQSRLGWQDNLAETIAREGMSLLIAGSETTAMTLSVSVLLYLNAFLLWFHPRKAEHTRPRPTLIDVSIALSSQTWRFTLWYTYLNFWSVVLI